MTKPQLMQIIRSIEPKITRYNCVKRKDYGELATAILSAMNEEQPKYLAKEPEFENACTTVADYFNIDYDALFRKGAKADLVKAKEFLTGWMYDYSAYYYSFETLAKMLHANTRTMRDRYQQYFEKHETVKGYKIEFADYVQQVNEGKLLLIENIKSPDNSADKWIESW